MSKIFILDLDNKELKDLLKQNFNSNIISELEFFDFLFMEIDDKSDVPVNTHIFLKKAINKEILISIKQIFQEKIGRKIKFCFKYDAAVDLLDKLLEHWCFFCEEMEEIKVWLENTTPRLTDNNVLIECENGFVFNKLKEQMIVAKIQNRFNLFFNVDKKIEIHENKNKQEKPKIINKKIEETNNIDYSESKILTDDIIKGNITNIEEIVKEGRYIIEGRIFYDNKSLIRELKREKDNTIFYLVSFYITNEKDTIKAMMFLDEGDGLLKKIENIKYARFQIDVKYNEKEEELVAHIKKMKEIPAPRIIDNALYKRIELHAHTKLSAMDSVLSMEDYIDTAVDCGHKAVAITDHGVIHSFPQTYKYAREKKLKLIFGMEGYLIDKEEKSKENIPFHIIILVKNNTGLKNLYKIVSDSHIKYFYKKPRILRGEIEKYRDGLLLGTACNQGELFQAVLAQKSEEELEKIVKFYDYLEIQPKCNNYFLVNNKTVSSEIQLQEINKKIYELGKKFNKPVVATGDIHFLKPEDKIYREVLLFGQGYDDFDEAGSADLSFKTTDWMLAEFSYLGEHASKEVVVDNANMICDMVEDNIQPVPDKPYPPQIKGAEQEIIKVTNENVKKIYGENIPELIQERIKKELNSIINNNYATLFYLAKKMVEQSMKDGYIVGSRGSVGSSLVAFLCGITEVNPLPAHYLCGKCKYIEFVNTDMVGIDLPEKKCPQCNSELNRDGYNIPFETFMGFKGDKIPDIDLNFSGEYQERIHKFIIDLFGQEKVFRAGTVITMQEKAIKKDFVNKYIEKINRKLKKAEIERLAKGCAGTKRSTGQHAGGLMLVPEDKEIYDFTPIQYAPKEDIIITHFECEMLHDTLVKLDALGHDLPTSLKRLCSELKINVEQIPLNDKKTMKLFSDMKIIGLNPDNYFHKVGVLGIPEYGTKLTREILEFTKPKTFSELIYISGISHGEDVWRNNAYELIKDKKATLRQVISVRDDIMNFLISKGLSPDKAFAIMEKVRKGKGISKEEENMMRKHKIPDWYINSCKKIKYLFPKAHATAYAIMSFRIAYIKVYYPLYFYADYFTREKDGFEYEFINMNFKNIKKLLETLKLKHDLEKKEETQFKVMEVLLEAKERGIEFLNVDLYESEAEVFKVKDNKILVPLVMIPGLGEKVAESIVRERKNGKFSSIEDLLKRTKPKPNKNVINFMKENNILGKLPETDQTILF